MEKMFLLFNIRKLSIKKPLVITNICSKCGKTEKVEIPLSNIKENIKLNRFGNLQLSNGIVFEIGEMKNPVAMLSKDKDKKI